MRVDADLEPAGFHQFVPAEAHAIRLALQRAMAAPAPMIALTQP
jgi:hypothetical protein